MSPGTRGRSSQARASTAHFCSGPPAAQTSAPVVGTHSGATPSLSADQVGRHHDLDEKRGGGLVGVDLAGHAPQLPHAEAAGAQCRRRGGAPEGDELLDLAQRAQRGTRSRAVDGLDAAVDRREVRRVERQAAQRPVAPQREPDLAGQLDGVGVDAHEQAPGQQAGDGARRVRTAPAAPDRWSDRQRLEHPPLVGVDGGEQVRQVRRGGHSGRGPAEPAGEAGHDVADGRHERDAAAAVPDQRPGPQGRQRHVEGRAGQVRTEQPGDLRDRHRLGVRIRHDEGLDDVQGDGVEVVARPVHRGADAGPGGQHGQVGGRGHGEVRPEPEEVGQRVVVLGTQPVDQRGEHRPPR